MRLDLKTYEPVDLIQVVPPMPSTEIAAVPPNPRLKRAMSLNSDKFDVLKEPEPMIGRQNFMNRRFPSKYGLESRRNFGSTQVLNVSFIL